MRPTNIIWEISDKLELKTSYLADWDRMKRVLVDAVNSGVYRQTAYLSPEFLDNVKSGRTCSKIDVASVEEYLGQTPEIINQITQSETGAVIFKGDESVLVILPPFPIVEASFHADVHILPMVSLLDDRPVVAVIFLRLGRYAVGVVEGDMLLASKTGTRYVKNRHRQGGSSQRRFERSRERLVRELYDKACAVAGEVIAPFRDSIDHLMFGGERHVLNGFVKRCRFVRELEKKMLNRRLPVGRPGQEALESATRDIWVGRVLIFTESDA